MIAPGRSPWIAARAGICSIVAGLAGLALASTLGGCGGDGAPRPDGGDVGGLDGGGDGADGSGGAAEIVVTTPSGVTAVETLDGYCDILEAVAAAASGRTVDDCANPNGARRVVLQAGRTYPVRKTLRLAAATEIGIADGTTGSATIAAAPGFAVVASDPSSACLVSVADGLPEVWLRDLTLTQAPGLTLSGACVRLGNLGLRRVRVTGFRAGGVVATCLPELGCDHETVTDHSTTLRVLSSLIDGNRSAAKGAGISTEGSGTTLLVAHSAVVNNTSDNDGGGVYLGGGWSQHRIQSSTISGNTTSGAGGGVLVRFVPATTTYVHILNSTITNNTAAGTGGGIEFEPPPVEIGSSHDVSVFSSIVAGNFSLALTFEWNINETWNRPTGVFNCTNSLIYVAPGYARPTDMGGCTFDVRNPMLGPLTPLGGEGNLPLHPLLAGSPAVDAALDDSGRDEQRNPWIADVDPPPPPVGWTMFDPLVDGDGNGTAVRDLGAYERNDRWQTELLAVRAQGPAAHSVVTIPGGYDRGAGTTYAAASAANEFVTYALPIGEPGRFDVTIGARKDTDAGKLQVAIADDPAGPWTDLGAEQDGYAATAAFASLGPFTTLFTSAGEKLVRLSVTGKNPASAGFRLYLDYIAANRSAAACPVTNVAAGGNHSCVLFSGGGVRCWGTNGSGQLGDGSGGDRGRPPVVDAISGVIAVSAGAAHTCALMTGGGVRCWGANDSGQLGDGSTTARATPPAEPVLSGVKAISAGWFHTCALMTGGGVRCWGANDSGQLGDGSTTGRLRPPTADVLTGASAISAGFAHTCALMTGGGVRCWGNNVHGQRGDGTMNDLATPPGTDVVAGVAAVSAGEAHTCVLTNAGGVRCWGRNSDGELGIGSSTSLLSPPDTDALSDVKQVVAASRFTCALTTGGGVRCWGYNGLGVIGDDTEIQAERISPASVDVLAGAASLAGGIAHACAGMTSGGVRCWGANEAGQLGDGMAPAFAITPPTLDMPGFKGTCP
jgi:alpha-tubulin suppressor-like RCC1 family protein